MTHRLDVADGRDVVARWCNLAEQRLEYLTELFETGRWRRYYSEHAFLENIQEAKTAVETWRSLSTREASPDNSAIDMSWLGHSQTASPDEGLCDEPDPLASPPTEIVAEPWPPGVSDGVEPMHVASDEAPSAPALDTPRLDVGIDLTLDAIAQRYPLLRNAL